MIECMISGLPYLIFHIRALPFEDLEDPEDLVLCRLNDTDRWVWIDCLDDPLTGGVPLLTVMH